jgi:hypothetical protein
MKKLFNNVGGNQFRLLTESIDQSSNGEPKEVLLLREAIKKIFSSGENKLKYSKLQNMGFGFIKNISEAQKCALKEARMLAESFGYKDDERKKQFVKENDGEMSDYDRSSSENGAPMAGTRIPREVRIGKEIIRYTTEISDRSDVEELKAKIIELAQELISLHQQQ